MTDIAIRVENLSKLYHIGALQHRPDTLRDALSNAFARFRRNGSTPTDRRSPVTTTICALRDVSFEVNEKP